MNKYLLILLLIFPFAGLADEGDPSEPRLAVSLFASSLEKGAGARLGLHGGDNFLWALDWNLSQSLGGVSAAVGKRFGGLDLLIGVSQAMNYYNPEAITLNVGGVDMTTTLHDGDGATAFIEADYKYLFVKWSYYEVEQNYHASRWTPGPKGHLIVNEGTVNQYGQALWLGVNILF
jgi:hypothetical protein